MGEAAEDILDGTVCECCGEFFDDTINGNEPPGFPRRCQSCKPPRRTKRREPRRRRPACRATTPAPGAAPPGSV